MNDAYNEFQTSPPDVSRLWTIPSPDAALATLLSHSPIRVRPPKNTHAGAHTLNIYESIESLRVRHLRASHNAVVAVLSLYKLLRDLETIAGWTWSGAACGGRGFKSDVAEANRAWISCGAVGCVSTAGMEPCEFSAHVL